MLGTSLLVAACGGSGDSSGGNRNRNSALLSADCYGTQKDKDDDVAKKQADYDDAMEAENELADREKEYDDAEREYKNALNGGTPVPLEINLQEAAFHKVPQIPRTTTTTSTTTPPSVTATTVKTNGSGNGNGNGNDNVGSENSAKLTKIKESKDRMDKAAKARDAAREKARFKDTYRKELDEARGKPVCGSTTVGGDDSTSTTEGGGVGLSGATTVPEDTTTTTYSNGDGTTTTTGAVTTTEAVSTPSTESPTSTEGETPTTVDETTTTTIGETVDPVPPAPELTCDAPVIEGGNTKNVELGKALELTFAACLDTRATSAISASFSPDWLSNSSDDPVVWSITPDSADTYQVQVFFIDPTTERAVSPFTTVTVTVTPKEDPCNGKTPLFDISGDSELSAASTCTEADSITVQLFRADGSTVLFLTVVRSSVAKPYRESLAGVMALTDIASGVAWHIAGGGRAGLPAFWMSTVPEDTTTTVTTEAAGTSTTDAAAPTTAGEPATTVPGSTTTAGTPTTAGGGSATTESPTTTEAPAPEDMSIVRALPVEVLVEEPTPGKPAVVIAVPSNTAALTCDSGCVSAASGLAPDQISTVEVSVDGGDWVVVDNGFVAPVTPGGATVRLRVTPSNGAPKILSTRIVPDHIDLVAEGVAKGAPANTFVVGDGSGSGAKKSSFPWWIVIVVIAVILLFFVYRRRKDDDEDTAKA